MPSLLFASKQINVETTDAIYKHNTFKVTIYQQGLKEDEPWRWRAARERSFSDAYLAPFKPDLDRIRYLEIQVVFNDRQHGGKIYRTPGPTSEDDMANIQSPLLHTAAAPTSRYRRRKQEALSGSLVVPHETFLSILSRFTDPEVLRKNCTIIFETPESASLLEPSSSGDGSRNASDYDYEKHAPGPNTDLVANPLSQFLSELVSFDGVTLEHHVLSTDAAWTGSSWQSRRDRRMQDLLKKDWRPSLGKAREVGVIGFGERGYKRTLNHDGQTYAEVVAAVPEINRRARMRARLRARQAAAAHEEALNIHQVKLGLVKAKREEAKAQDEKEPEKGEPEKLVSPPKSIFGDGEPAKGSQALARLFSRTPSPPPRLPSPPPLDLVSIDTLIATRPPNVDFKTWKTWALEFSPREALEERGYAEKLDDWKAGKQERSAQNMAIAKAAMIKQYDRVVEKHGDYEGFRNDFRNGELDPDAYDTSDDEGITSAFSFEPLLAWVDSDQGEFSDEYEEEVSDDEHETDEDEEARGDVEEEEA